MTSATYKARLKVIVYSILPTIFLIIIISLIAEIYLRFHYSGTEKITGVTDWEIGTYKKLTYYWDTYHPTLGWANLPGYMSDSRIPFKVTINQQGLRAQEEYSAMPRSGTTRIAMLGDSCTFGEDVDDDQTISHYFGYY